LAPFDRLRVVRTLQWWLWVILCVCIFSSIVSEIQFSVLFVNAESGRLLSFGYGQQGQLGHGGSNNNVENPRVIAALKDVHIVQIAAGSQHVLALSAGSLPFFFNVDCVKSLSYFLS
jgi:hypothetical protein